MRLQVFHRTRYLYRLPVRDSYNELRLHPATEDKSRLEFFLLQVQPPVRLRHFRDVWLNYVHYFELSEPHHELVIEAQFTLNTRSAYQDGVPTGVNLAEMRELRDEMISVYMQSSRYVENSAEAWRLALDVAGDEADAFAACERIMQHIHANWTYAPNITTASTHVSEVLAAKGGVCQDFAHLMIALCRAIGVPARYVSGYLYNGPGSHLRGAQASHAWCEVFIPGRGWFGLDPTNNTRTDERHIKVATGRDYNDAAPVIGHFDGPPGATAALEVELLVDPV